jgi:2-iminobutanoate/2-iminopropanoate deaminase
LLADFVCGPRDEMIFSSYYNKGGLSMNTHTALLTALFAGVIAVGAAAAQADEGEHVGAGKVGISTIEAPAAIGPYSQAIRVGRTVYVSGEIGKDPMTGQFTGPSIGDQTDQALKNVAAILAAAGLTLDNVVATTVYLLDVNDFAGMNAAYASFFTKPFPARATIQVAALPTKGALVEISAIAVAFDAK